MPKTKVLVDYDGWIKNEIWKMPLDKAIKKATQIISDKKSPVIMIAIYSGDRMLYQRKSYSKSNYLLL